MNVKTISVNRGLIELKTLDARIATAISESKFAMPNKASAKTVGNKTVETFKTDAAAAMSKVLGLIKYRDSLKREIVKSNAETKVTVAEVEMTVAEAIERKTSIVLEKRYLSEISNQLARANREVEAQKMKAENGLDVFLKSTLGEDGTKDSALVQTLTDNYFATREYVILSGNSDLETYYKEYYDKLVQFEGDVDAALTDINALTQISVTVS